MQRIILFLGILGLFSQCDDATRGYPINGSATPCLFPKQSAGVPATQFHQLLSKCLV